MPPALATKSGAHRISRSSSCWATASDGELVVGRAGDRAAAQGGHRLGVEHGAERARREHVDVGARGRRRGRSTRRRARRRARACSASTSATTSRAPAAARPRASAPPTRPRPDDGDRAPVEVERAPDALAGDADRLLDAERGPRARVAGAAALDGEAGDVGVRSAITVMSGVGGPDVLGGPVAPVEDVDGVAEVQQRGAPRRSPASGGSPSGRMITPLPPPCGRSATAALKVIARDSRSASAHRVARVGVAPHAAAAERRAARGRVHGDDRVEARAAASADEQLLVLEGLQVAVDDVEASGMPRRRRRRRPGRASRRRGRLGRGLLAGPAWSPAGRSSASVWTARRVGRRGRGRLTAAGSTRRLGDRPARRVPSRRRCVGSDSSGAVAPPRSGGS